MSEEDDLSFLEVLDIETLMPDQMDRRNAYWASKTPNERLREAMRLNIAKWGEEVFLKGMDKTKIRVIKMSEYRKAGSE